MVCKNKLLVFLLLGVFMLNMASAAEWDNWVNYENDDMKVRIVNALNLGEELGTAELKSHKSVNEILHVAPGNSRVVMYYDFDFKNKYTDGLGDVEFINMTDGEVIDKDYNFVIWDTIIEEKNNYSTVCNDVYNATTNNMSNVCEQVFEGTYLHEYEGWVEVEYNDIPKGKDRIGLATDVNLGETIDGVWTIAGKKIKKHAVWTADLNVDILYYYNLDEISGTIAVDGVENNNGTATNEAIFTAETEGIINTSADFSTGDYEISLGNIITGDSNSGNEITINFWVNATADSVAMARRVNFDTKVIQIALSAGDWCILNSGITTCSDTSATLGVYQMITFHLNGSNGVNIYQDGLSVSNGSFTFSSETAPFIIGRAGNHPEYSTHNLDEIGFWNRSLTQSEVTQLYNGGSGITYTDVLGAPNVTLISPVNDSNFTSPNIDFVLNATDNEEVDNVTLYIDGVLNETNSSGVNGTYTFSKTISEGVHNWSILTFNNASLFTQSETRIFNFTLPPKIINITLNSPEDNLVTQNQTIIFNTTINATNLEIINVSLLIDGVINETNTSGVIGEYIFPKDLAFSNHNWSIQVVDNETNTTNSSTRDLTILDGSASGIWTDEYQVRIIAASLTESDFEINNVVITQEGDNLWKINTTEGDYEVARAQVMKTFFYGSGGSDPRINRTTGLLKIQTQDGRDVDKKGYFIETSTTIPGGDSQEFFSNLAITFNDVISNNDFSSWSNFGIIANQYHIVSTCSWEVPTDTTLHSVSTAGSGGGSVSSSEIGTDTSTDELDNPVTATLRSESGRDGQSDSADGTSTTIFLYVGTITITPTSTGTPTTTEIDFNVNYSVPEISPMPNITLNSPEDSIEQINTEPITFNITSTITGSTLNEIKLFINGILNETKSLSGTEDTETFSKTFPILGIYNWSVEVCDVNDNCALSETRDFSILPFTVVEYTFDTNITEGESNIISVEILVSDGSSLTNSILNYDGTNFTTSVIFANNTYLIASTVDAPLVSANTNISFNFYLTVDSVTYQLQTLEQEILNLDFDICGGLSNDTLLNMSLFDEETITNITGTIEVNANIISKTSGETVATANGTFISVHSGAICFSPVSSYSLYYLDTEIRYFADNYVTEFYHIQQADLAEYPVNLSLFPLNQNDSTEFSVTYKNNAFIFTEGAVIQLQRKYIGDDIYEVVEAPITGDGGSAVLHIDLNTNKYRASIVKDGELLDLFENIVFSCANELSGDCTHSFDGTVDPNNDVPIEDITDFTYSVSIDEDNQTVTVLFAVPSGTPSTVNVLLEQIDMFGNSTACNTTVITSAGSITCDYKETIEKSILTLSISKNDVQLTILNYVNDPLLDMDGMNFFIVFLFMISLVGMAIASPEWMIIISVMVLIISGTMLLLSGTSLVMGLGAIAWIIIAAAIIILKMAKQEDR